MTEQEIKDLINSLIGKLKISQLPEAKKTDGLYSVGYVGNNSVRYKVNLLQGLPLVIEKTFITLAVANSTKNPISEVTGLPIKVGQIIAVTDGIENGIYRLKSLAPDGTPTYEFISELGNLSQYALKSELSGLSTEPFSETIYTDILI